MLEDEFLQYGAKIEKEEEEEEEKEEKAEEECSGTMWRFEVNLESNRIGNRDIVVIDVIFDVALVIDGGGLPLRREYCQCSDVSTIVDDLGERGTPRAYDELR
uniref:Uncharacterized protein n=1 Tax=Vespula pensylvanica TaxID=30213 RepID=A0A834P292_VESPE|nr:hypothetical protein H0235_008009 [Vespula pensylvanica]